MKTDLKRLLVSTQILVATAIPFSAYAASLTFGEQIAQESLLSILMTFLISTLVGITSLLHSMKKEYEKSDTIKRVKLFVASAMFGSNTAGLFMFFGSDTLGVPNGYKAAAIMLAAYGGNWFIERAVNNLTSKYLPEPSTNEQPNPK